VRTCGPWGRRLPSSDEAESWKEGRNREEAGAAGRGGGDPSGEGGGRTGEGFVCCSSEPIRPSLPRQKMEPLFSVFFSSFPISLFLRFLFTSSSEFSQSQALQSLTKNIRRYQYS
jgi:hypothetical protein